MHALITLGGKEIMCLLGDVQGRSQEFTEGGAGYRRLLQRVRALAHARKISQPRPLFTAHDFRLCACMYVQVIIIIIVDINAQTKQVTSQRYKNIITEEC